MNFGNTRFDSGMATAQRVVWNSMISPSVNVVNVVACRGFGKTYLLQKFIDRSGLYNKIGIITPTLRQYNILIDPFINKDIVSRIDDVDFSCDIILVDESSGMSESNIEFLKNFDGKIVFMSSGTWQDNHFGKFVIDNIGKLTTHFVPYWMLPWGWFDMDNIAEARSSMSHSAFLMEYCAAILHREEFYNGISRET